jgi:hypothetical protein
MAGNSRSSLGGPQIRVEIVPEACMGWGLTGGLWGQSRK